MNPQLNKYKLRFVTLALLLGYAFLHIRLTGVYVDANLTDMLQFTVRLPYGQRLLVPYLNAALAKVLPFLNAGELFFLSEVFFISLFYWILRQWLSKEFSNKEATGLSWLFILLLPLITIINYRFSNGGEAAFFYPYDTASLFFTITGLMLCFEKRWTLFFPLLFLATLNRESSVLMVLLIPALHWHHRKHLFKIISSAVFVYLFARGVVFYLTANRAGQVAEFYFHGGPHSLFEVNLNWLFDRQYIFLFIFCFAGLPLFWFAFYDYIKCRYRPLRYVCFGYFMGLLMVGYVMESRIYQEIAVILYMPVCSALKRWMQGLAPILPETNTGLWGYLDRYSIVLILLLLAVFHGCLRF